VPAIRKHDTVWRDLMSDNADQPMQDLKPTVWIGKQGCTGTMIEEIVAQLKKRTMIKVKWLQNTDVDPKAVAGQAQATLVEVRGRTMVLARKGKAAARLPRAPEKEPPKVTAKAKARAAVGSPEKPSPGSSHGSSGKSAARPAPGSSGKRAPGAAAKAPASRKPKRSGVMGRAKK
jgi:RNA-binding protein